MADPSDTAQSTQQARDGHFTHTHLGKRCFEFFFLPPVQRPKEVKKPHVFLPMTCILGEFLKHEQFQAACTGSITISCRSARDPNILPLNPALPFPFVSSQLHCPVLKSQPVKGKQTPTHPPPAHESLYITNIKVYLSSSSYRDFFLSSEQLSHTDSKITRHSSFSFLKYHSNKPEPDVVFIFFANAISF